jgi:hypothetical protein
MLSLILLVFALVLFVLAAFVNQPDPSPARGRLVCFGLACMVAAEIATHAAPLLTR